MFCHVSSLSLLSYSWHLSVSLLIHSHKIILLFLQKLLPGPSRNSPLQIIFPLLIYLRPPRPSNARLTSTSRPNTCLLTRLRACGWASIRVRWPHATITPEYSAQTHTHLSRSHSFTTHSCSLPCSHPFTILLTITTYSLPRSHSPRCSHSRTLTLNWSPTVTRALMDTPQNNVLALTDTHTHTSHIHLHTHCRALTCSPELYAIMHVHTC